MSLVQRLPDTLDSARRTFKISLRCASLLLCVAKLTPRASPHPRMTCVGVALYFTAKSPNTGSSRTAARPKNRHQPIFATATGNLPVGP